MKGRLLPALVALLIRAIGATLRWRADDRAGVLDLPADRPLIWVFWHNRVFGMPLVYRKFLKRRKGSVLTSPSGDGEIIARVMAKFGVGSVRGSSNKRPAAALREMVALLKGGGDLAVTPDGPRGPVYELQGGLVKVAQLTGVPVLPIRLRYSRAITLKTWDRFQIPLPFARAEVVFEELVEVPRELGDEGFEAVRAGLEAKLKGEA